MANDEQSLYDQVGYILLGNEAITDDLCGEVLDIILAWEKRFNRIKQDLAETVRLSERNTLPEVNRSDIKKFAEGIDDE